jgi:hypothetical protein
MEEKLDEVLLEMHKRVGRKRLICHKPDWFLQSSWTQEEQDSFAEWFMQYCKDNKEFYAWATGNRANTIRNRKLLAQEFMFRYGWTLKDYSPKPLSKKMVDISKIA